MYSHYDYRSFTFTDDNNNEVQVKYNDLPRSFNSGDAVLFFQNYNVSRDSARQLKKDFLAWLYTIKKSRTNYETWARTAVSQATYEIGRETVRDVYQCENILIYEHIVLPHNWFIKNYTFAVVDYVIKQTPGNVSIIESFGGKITNEWYTSEGYCMAYFNDEGMESLEKSFNFINYGINKLVV